MSVQAFNESKTVVGSFCRLEASGDLHPYWLIIGKFALDKGIAEVYGGCDPFLDYREEQECSYSRPCSHRAIVGSSIILLQVSSQTDASFELLDGGSIRISLYAKYPGAGDYLGCRILYFVFIPGPFGYQLIDFGLGGLQEVVSVSGKHGLVPVQSVWVRLTFLCGLVDLVALHKACGAPVSVSVLSGA